MPCFRTRSLVRLCTPPDEHKSRPETSPVKHEIGGGGTQRQHASCAFRGRQTPPIRSAALVGTHLYRHESGQ